MNIDNGNSLNFTDVLYIISANSFTLNVYRKSANTKIIIHADFHHPYTQQMVPFNAFLHRILVFSLSQNDFRQGEYIAVKMSVLIKLYTDKYVNIEPKNTEVNKLKQTVYFV